MAINIIETRDISTNACKVRQARLVDIDGSRYLQMMGTKHEIMPYTWSDGVIMSCSVTLSLDAVSSNPELYFRGYGDGCELCFDIPQELL